MKPGRGRLCHTSVCNVLASEAFRDFLMPLRTFSIHFFTYCFHAVWISNAIRSPLSQGRAGGGGGDADGKALVSAWTSVRRDGRRGCRRVWGALGAVCWP